MGFKFAQSEIELTYKGKIYPLKVTTRLGADLSAHMKSHPLNLAIEINKCAVDGLVPPMFKMADLFEFMLKRAGCPDVDYDQVYSAMFDDQDENKVAESVGEILGLFMPQVDEVETENPKPKAVRKNKSR